MLSRTLTLGLQQYAIGPKVRALRVKREIGLVQLGEHTGLSPAMLSKIERGLLFPTLPTLLKIAMVFGVGLEHFFVETEAGPTIAIVRKADRLRLPDRPGEESPAYFFESLDFPVTNRKFETYYAEFETGPKSMEPHVHAGAEVIYVISGNLIVTIDGEDSRLGEGDSIYFESTYPHSYRRQGRATCAAIVVIAS